MLAPFTSDASRWYDWAWINMYEDDGTTYRLAPPGLPRLCDAEAKTYGDVVGQYRWHPEAKSLAPDDRPCAADSAGLLRRMPVLAAHSFRSIGKETDRRWEREDDVSLLNPRLLEYRRQESARLVADPVLQHRARLHSIRALAKAAGVTPKVVKRVRRGDRIRKSTARKLEKALVFLAVPKLNQSKTTKKRTPDTRVRRRARETHGTANVSDSIVSNRRRSPRRLRRATDKEGVRCSAC